MPYANPFTSFVEATATYLTSDTAITELLKLQSPEINALLCLNTHLETPLLNNLVRNLLEKDILDRQQASDIVNANAGLKRIEPDLLRRLAHTAQGATQLTLLTDTTLYPEDKEVVEILKSQRFTDDRPPLWSLFDLRPSLLNFAPDLLQEREKLISVDVLPHASLTETISGTRHLFAPKIQQQIYDKALSQLKTGITDTTWPSLFALLANPNTATPIREKIYHLIHSAKQNYSDNENNNMWGPYDRTISRQTIFTMASTAGLPKTQITTPWEKTKFKQKQTVYAAIVLLSPKRYPSMTTWFEKIETRLNLPLQNHPTSIPPLIKPSLIQNLNHLTLDLPRSVRSDEQGQTVPKPIEYMNPSTILLSLQPYLDNLGPQGWSTAFSLSQNYSGTLFDLLQTVTSLVK